MSDSPPIIRGRVTRGMNALLLARLVNPDGEPVVAASFQANATVRVWNVTAAADPTDPDEEIVVPVSSVLTDTLQTGGAWPDDGQGYNLRYELDGDVLDTGGQQYRVEFELTGIDLSRVFAVFILDTVPVYTT
ncbi:MAG: hypothetical protein ABL309_13890 [Phycisphaerales bacterium]